MKLDMNILEAFRGQPSFLRSKPAFEGEKSFSQLSIDETQDDIIGVPYDIKNPAHRQNDAMVSFNHILRTGNAPFSNDGNINLSVNLEVDDAYNQTVATVQANVTARITNPSADDKQGQLVSTLLEKEPWNDQDRVDWERGISYITSDEVSKVSGFDKYRTQNQFGVQANGGNLNTLSIDIKNGTSKYEFDCDSMSFTEGMILQTIENSLLPVVSNVSGDTKTIGEYYLAPCDVSYNLQHGAGYHAAIISSVTGNVIEGTESGGRVPYKESADPNYNFDDFAAGAPFISKQGNIYSFNYMDKDSATLIRIENGEINVDLDLSWHDIPEVYLYDNYTMSDDMERMLELEQQISAHQFVINQFYRDTYIPFYSEADVENARSAIKSLEAQQEAHMLSMAHNGTFEKYVHEVELLGDTQNEYDTYMVADYDTFSLKLNSNYLSNLDDYFRVSSEGASSSSSSSSGQISNIFNVVAGNKPMVLDEGYEMSADMEYILEQQKIIEFHQDQLKMPEELSPWEYMNALGTIAKREVNINERLEGMKVDGSIVGFDAELRMLSNAESSYQISKVLQSASIGAPDETVKVPTAVGFRGAIQDIDLSRLRFDDVSDNLQHFINQVNQISIIEDEIKNNPDDQESLENHLEAAIDSFERDFNSLDSEDVNGLQQEVSALITRQQFENKASKPVTHDVAEYGKGYSLDLA